MSIDHLELTPDLISALFPESLVSTPDAHAPVTRPGLIKKLQKEQPLIYTGGNSRFISFIFHDTAGDFLPENQHQFLQKMLSACKYHFDDIALINSAKQHITVPLLKQQLNTRILFLWGVQPESAGIGNMLTEFEQMTVSEVTVLRIPDPGLMSGDGPGSTELKKRLWICLKKIFSL